MFTDPWRLAIIAWQAIFILWVVTAVFDRRIPQPSVRQPGPLISRTHWLFAVLASVLLFWPRAAVYPLDHRLLSSPILGIALTWIGIAFAGLARLSLGANWSSAPRIRSEHTLTTVGPYRIVRHPIYSGLLLAFLGTAIILGQARGYLAFVIVFVTWLVKSRTEDRLLAARFGPDFDTYRRRVKALIPGIL